MSCSEPKEFVQVHGYFNFIMYTGASTL